MGWLWAESIRAHEALLGPTEVHHLKKVLRGRPEAEVRLVDGRGQRATGVWQGDERVRVTDLEAWPPPRLGLILALGAKGPTEEAFRRAAELGAARVAPVLTQRSRDAGARGRLDRGRLERIIRSGCAQAGNPWQPEIGEVRPWAELRDELGPEAITVLDPAAPAPLVEAGAADWLAIGPEGGWEPGEAAGCRTAALGPYVLRTPVAVTAALAVLHQREVAPCTA